MELPVQNLSEFINQHPRFQEKNLLKTRVELSKKILDSGLSDEKQSWLLHRLAYAHTPEELIELITQVN